MDSLAAHTPLEVFQMVLLITVNQTCRCKNCWHFIVWPSYMRSQETAQSVSGWLRLHPRQTGCLPEQNTQQMQQTKILLNRLCFIEKVLFFNGDNDINILCVKQPTISCASSCCILDSAQSFRGCYLGQFGVGWRLEEAQTGKKLM